jgi:hypothetical protein
MTTHDHTIRELSTSECETISGGVGWFAAIAVWAGAAAIGAAAAVLTADEEIQVPNLEFPS